MKISIAFHFLVIQEKSGLGNGKPDGTTWRDCGVEFRLSEPLADVVISQDGAD